MSAYDEFHRRSIEDRDNFWAEQAKLIDWKTPPQQICDYSKPPFARWFVGGTTNLCHNAVDRHAAANTCSVYSGVRVFPLSISSSTRR